MSILILYAYEKSLQHICLNGRRAGYLGRLFAELDVLRFIPDLFFRPLFAFFIIELKSRKVIHVMEQCSDNNVAQN
jgi:hypothetical protein